jgi:16S rRNA processing protein RimM
MSATVPRPGDGTASGWLEVGRITKPHGLHGEVVVQLLSDYPEVRLAPGSHLRAGDTDLVVRAARPHQGRWLVQFDAMTDRTAAERLAGLTLTGEAFEDPEALWVHDLVGSRVVEEASGTDRGRVVAVVANPAHDLLELDTGVLVPVVFVRALRDGVAFVDVPDGLFEG